MTTADRSSEPGLGRALWVLIVAGVPTGVLIVGVGSRLAMFVLRVTTGGAVDGVDSDDGFTIGRFTLGGTYNLLMLGAVTGLIGAAAYQWVRPWLLGPRWFRYATVGLSAGAVVGSILVHADGIDFRLLRPVSLAVALFVALPAAFGVTIAVIVDAVEARPVASGRAAWIVPVAAVILFPATIVILAFMSLWLCAWLQVRRAVPLTELAERPSVRLVARSAWLLVAVAGLLALIGDINDLRAVK